MSGHGYLIIYITDGGIAKKCRAGLTDPPTTGIGRGMRGTRDGKGVPTDHDGYAE